MNCLLDTCTLLWMADQAQHLSPTARSLLEDVSNTLVVSQVSTLEIQFKYSVQKLPLALPPSEFIPKAVKTFGMTYLQLNDAHIWSMGKLPLFHRDPFDRLLIAQAIYEGMILITPDPNIHLYPVRAQW